MQKNFGLASVLGPLALTLLQCSSQDALHETNTKEGLDGSDVCATASEGQDASLACPDGQTITQIVFASYGTGGSCGAFSASSCNADGAVASVAAACVGQASCVVTASNGTFGDPCPGADKTLAIQARCSGSAATPPPATPPPSTPPVTPPDAPPASGNTTVATTDPNIFLTPENWLRPSAAFIQTSNPGAYLKVGFTGTSIAVVLDTSTGVFELPKIGIQIDGGDTQYVSLSTYAGSLTVPLASGLASGAHQARISLEGLGVVDRWNSDFDRLKILNLVLDGGAQTLPPALRPNRMVAYGDSITEGASTLASDDFVYNAQWSTTWDSLLSSSLNAEISVIGFQGQGYEQEGQGQVPGFLTAYNQIRAGVPRTFSSPNYVFIHHGSNGIVTQSDVATMLGRIQASYPNAAVYLDVPFGGYNRDAIRNAFAAQSNPNSFLIDLGGQGETVVGANSTDGAHPNPTGDALLEAMMLPFIH